MSHFSDGQVNQLANALEAAGWSAEDVTRLGQAGKSRLTEIRMSLDKSDIVSAIEAGRTKLWFHPDQEEGCIVENRRILAYLTESGFLSGCADISELQAIQAKGFPFFWKYFRRNAVFGWRGVSRGYVPFLFVKGNREVVLEWSPVGSLCRVEGAALHRL